MASILTSLLAVFLIVMEYVGPFALAYIVWHVGLARVSWFLVNSVEAAILYIGRSLKVAAWYAGLIGGDRPELPREEHEPYEPPVNIFEGWDAEFEKVTGRRVSDYVKCMECGMDAVLVAGHPGGKAEYVQCQNAECRAYYHKSWDTPDLQFFRDVVAEKSSLGWEVGMIMAEARRRYYVSIGKAKPNVEDLQNRAVYLPSDEANSFFVSGAITAGKIQGGATTAHPFSPPKRRSDNHNV